MFQPDKSADMMKTSRFFSVIQIIIVLLSCQGCTNHKIDTDIDFNRVLVESESDTAQFSFSELLDSGCEWFTIIQPYTYLDRLSDSTSIDFTRLSNTGIEIRDDICVLVLIKDNAVFDHYLLYSQRVKLSRFDDLALYDIEKPLALRRQDDEYLIEAL